MQLNYVTPIPTKKNGQTGILKNWGTLKGHVDLKGGKKGKRPIDASEKRGKRRKSQTSSDKKEGNREGKKEKHP